MTGESMKPQNAANGVASESASGVSGVSIDSVDARSQVADAYMADVAGGMGGVGGNVGGEVNLTVRAFVRLLPVLLVGLCFISGGLYLAIPSNGPTATWGSLNRLEPMEMPTRQLLSQDDEEVRMETARLSEAEARGIRAELATMSDDEIDTRLREFLRDAQKATQIEP